MKKVVIALDNVHPVPCVLLVLYLGLVKILKSDLFKKISSTFFDFKCPPLIKTFLAPKLINLFAACNHIFFIINFYTC